MSRERDSSDRSFKERLPRAMVKGFLVGFGFALFLGIAVVGALFVKYGQSLQQARPEVIRKQALLELIQARFFLHGEPSGAVTIPANDSLWPDETNPEEYVQFVNQLPQGKYRWEVKGDQYTLFSPNGRPLQSGRLPEFFPTRDLREIAIADLIKRRHIQDGRNSGTITLPTKPSDWPETFFGRDLHSYIGTLPPGEYQYKIEGDEFSFFSAQPPLVIRGTLPDKPYTENSNP